MAVYSSPFGSRAAQPAAAEPAEETNLERMAREMLELSKSADTTIQRIRAQQNLSASEKQFMIKEVERLRDEGGASAKKPTGGFISGALGRVKDIATQVIAPWAPKPIQSKVREGLVTGYKSFERGVSGAIQEVAEAQISRGQSPFRPFVPPVLKVGAEVAGRAVEATGRAPDVAKSLKGELTDKEIQIFKKYGLETDKETKLSFGDIGKRIVDPKYKYRDQAINKAVAEINPYYGFATELGVATAADPLTYVTGVGNVKFIGRAGKLSLAQRFSTSEMIRKYPQLAGKFNEIVRLGQHAPIAGFKDILKAEGIETGVRVLGQTIRGTEAVSAPVGRVLSGAWEKAMDIATGVRNSGLVMSPSSRAFMMDVGRRTKGAYRLTEVDALRNVANWSARQFAKGVTPYQANRFINQIRDTINEAREAGIADELSNLAETANPLTISGGARFSALPENQQNIVRKYVEWQRNVYAETEAVYKQFGADFGTEIPDFSWIENYVFHKVTDDAARWLGENTGKGKRYDKVFRAGDLDASDIADMSSPLRYRKFRGPQTMPDGSIKYETFMGEEIRQGTIKEINEIFKRQTGTDINFFETDIGTIAESYAFSMAKMRGREAYVRRLMQYGDTAAAKLLNKTIPDPALRSAAETQLAEATRIRNSVRDSMGRRMNDLRDVIKRGVRDAENLVNGNLRQRRMNERATDAVLKKIAQMEENVVKLREQANNLAAHKRGEFDVVYSAMLQDIQNLKASLLAGTAELDEIRLGLQTTLQSMYPNMTKMPDDIEVLADRIAAARGVPASREARAINARMREIRAQLELLSPSSAEAAELTTEINRLKDLDNGFRIMAEYRMAQDYAPDNGFLFISGREMAETDEMQIGFKLLRTSANGFPDPNDVMAVRVFGNDELIDFRTSGGVARTFGVYDFGDGLIDQMALAGIDATPLKDGLDAVRVGLPIDPELEQAFPEVADLVKLMEGNQAREIMPYGDPQLIKAIYEEMVDATTGLLVKMQLPNPELVARNMVDGALGFVADLGVETNSARGILLPAQLFDDAAELDDVVVLLAPRVALQATDSVTGSVQDASSPLIQAIMRTDGESAANAARARLNELAARQTEIADTTTALKQELTTLGKRKGGFKSAATKRKNSAALAKERAGTARNVPREVIIDGKPEMLTLAQINKRFEALTATEQRLRANMEATLLREQAALREGGMTMRGTQARLADNTDRLRVLLDEALALQTWDMGAGMMVRDEIAAAIDLIATMPPAGVAGDATRNWLAGVQRGMTNSSLIQDPSIRTAYERLHQLVSWDEFNMAIADEAVAVSARALDDLDTGRVGAILDTIDKRTLEGWEAIEGLGVQIPQEVLDVWRPNIAKMLAKQNRGTTMAALDYLNKVFKTYAIGTVGFVIRNLYSAMFMNAVAGVDPQTMLKGYKAAHYYNKYGADRWLDELGVTGLERQQYEQAMLAVEASGRRGFFSDLSEPVLKGTRRERAADKVLNNFYTRAVRGANSRVEDAVRFPVALKAIEQGDDYVGAAQQVTRYHFDYSDLSRVDETMLKFIPFWIWTTRNIPNQLANQFMRPKVYSLWENLQESLPADDNILMPKWQKDYEPLGLTRFGVSPSIILRPDLPHQRLLNSITQFTNPSKLIGSAYPTYKLPIERIADKQLGLDIPITDEPREAVGIDKGLAAALNALGLEGAAPKVRSETGEEVQMITDFPSYALGNILPLIATLQRISGGKLGGKESYADRQNAAIATFTGIPLDFVTDRMQGSEAIGRQFAIKDYAGELNRLGLLKGAAEFKKEQSDLSQAEKNRQKKIKSRVKEEASEAKRKQEALDKRNLKAAEMEYGKDSPEYKFLKDLIAERKRKEQQEALKKEFAENPIQIAGDE